jgi:hypothetical protein
MKRLYICTILLAGIVTLSIISRNFISAETDKITLGLQELSLNPTKEKLLKTAQQWEKFHHHRVLVSGNEEVRTITSLFYHLQAITSEKEIKPVAEEIILNLQDLKKKQLLILENIL